jgi:phage repressor protein C with HTH and peptisase S24 domain
MAEIEAKREMNRAEVAEYLHRFADKLDTNDETRQASEHSTANRQDEGEQSKDPDETTAEEDTESQREWTEQKHEHESETATDEDPSGEKVTFMVGNESTTINPPATVTFEMMVDSESSLIGTDTGRTASFALHWDDTDVSEDDELSIQ